MKILKQADLEGYITGANILGCGGGGSPESGRAMVKDAYEKGFKFRLADPNELPQDKLLCILGGVGGGVPKEIRDHVEPYSQKLKGTREERLIRLKKASEVLSDFIGEEFCSYIASETGPGNGIIPMYMAALEGKPCVDGDCCGRAKPELALSLTHVAGIPITPLSIVTPFDEALILKNAVDDYRAEDICRYVAIASGGSVTVARCPAKVEEYKKGMALNQVTKCIKIGEALKLAKDKNKDLSEAFIRETDAEKIFEGVVASYELEGRGGFNWGNWHINGSGDFKGHSFKIWFKNENLISWLDGKPKVVCPDLICVVETETCYGLSNFAENERYEGRKVTVFGIKAPDVWRTSKGIEVFSPRHFGYNIEYRQD